MQLTNWNWQCERDGCWKQKCKADFKSFEDIFPRGINFTDLDGFVELNGRFLIQEWKYPNTILPKGQRIAFERFTEINGNCVLSIEGHIGELRPRSVVVFWEGKQRPPISVDFDGLRKIISRWAALAEQGGEHDSLR